MKIVPSEDLKKHLMEQNVKNPEGGFDVYDVPDFEYEAEKLLLLPSHIGESAEAFEERLQYRLIWKLFGVPANGSQKGVDLTSIQRIEAMRREVAEVVEKHLPNVSADISKAMNLGHEKVVEALSDLKTFEGESHAEVIKIKSELHADLMEIAKHGIKIMAGMLGVIAALIVLLCLLSGRSHAQGTPVIANQANGAKLHVTCDAGCSSSSSPTVGAAMPSTATPVGGTDGVNFQALHLDGSFNLKINCAVGCAGGSTTPSNAFANPTTAGLSMSFNTMWNGTSWDLVKGDTTNGLWVNCKSGCAGGSSTPTDAFANPATAGLSQGFLMMWNGASWDRVKGDTTNGLWANVKSLPSLAAGAALIGKAGFDPTTPGTTNGISMYSAALQTGNITTNATSIPVTTAGYSIATVTVHGTYAGVTYVFEFSDDAGTTYYPTTCTRTDTNAQVNGDGPLTNTNRAYDCSVYAASNFRVRSTAFTSGTAVVGITLSSAPIEAAPTVALATGSTTAVTQATGTNLHAVIDTGSTTAVTQATGTNLHAVIDTGSTTAATQATGTNLHTVTDATSVTTATLNAETTKVIGTARIIGNGGATLDAATSQNVATPTNALSILCEFNTTPTTITTGNSSPFECDNAGNALVNLKTAIPAGTNLMGKVGIDQTTPGTTNGVQDAATSATGAAPPAKAGYVGFLGSGATGGFLTGAAVGDTYKNVNISTATTTLLVTGVSGRQVRITAMHLVTAAANNVAIIEGTGATCGTGSAGMAGGTTAASGYNFAANGGLTIGSGLGTVMQTATTGDSVCVVTSAATQLSGGMQYTIY